MYQPDVRIKIGFDLSAAGRGDFFTIGDPVKGTWGTASLPLAGDILTDVTNDVRTVSWRRGRSRELDVYQAGAATIELDNRARLYDPTAGTATSPYAPSIVPRKETVIEIDSIRQFSGQVEDWDVRFDLSGDSVSSAKCSDGLVFLSSQKINDHITVEQTTGERINAILNRTEIDWPSARRSINTGKAIVQADEISNSPTATEYLQQVSQAEPGALFVGRDGRLVFRDRESLQRVSGFKFSDDGTGIPFTDIEVSLGTEQLRNRVTVSRLNGGTAVADDLDSQALYGVAQYDLSNSLLSSDTAASDLANWILGVYGRPQLRISSLTVNLLGLSESQAANVLSLDLGDAVNVVFTPNGVGDPINKYVGIDSIEATLSPASYIIRFGFSQAAGVFILDSPVLGELDNDVLGW